MNRGIKKILCVVSLTILMIGVNLDKILAISNDENRNFKQITIDDGLSQTTITKIFQDSNGYMWFGTKDGLNKYNGHKFDIYKPNDKSQKNLVGNSITDIVEDNKGNIWIGTSTGLSKININTSNITNYLPNKHGCNLSNHIIRDVLVSKEGEILVATDDGLNKYDEKTDNFIRIFNDSKEENALSNQVIYSLEDDEENYWVGTKNGLNKINKETNEITKYYSNEENNSLVSNWIYTLYIDDLGYLWVGTYYGGLNRINLDTFEIESYTVENSNIPGNYIRDILRDSSGTVWVATDFGFTKLNEMTRDFTVYKSRSYDRKSICSDDVLDIYESESGSIWIGTWNGLNLFNPENLFNHYKNDPLDENTFSSSSISGIYKDNDDIFWIGTIHDGVNIFDRKNKKVTRLSYKDKDPSKRISNNYIREIVGIDNEVWIATEHGLNKYDKNTDTITVYKDIQGLVSNDILTLQIDKDGVLWIGTRDGVSSFDRKDKFTDYTKLFEKEGIEKSQVLDIYEYDDNTIFFSMKIPNGIMKFDKRTKDIKQYIVKEEYGESYALTTSINSDNKGNLWLSTDYGLIKYNIKTDSYKLYTEKDGLSNNFVYGSLLDNEGNVWVSTNYGISKFDIEEERFINFDSTDGLQDNEFNQYSYYKNDNGEMFFGGVNGLTSFDPAKIKEKDYVPKVRIESIVGPDNHILIKESIKVNYTNNRITFNFFMPEYSNTKKIQYAYKMSDIDKDWILSENGNYANYTNLKPGDYTFEVIGRNSSGQWSEPTSIKITITTPIWMSGPAYIIYTIMILCILYFIYNRVKILNALVKQRTLELNTKLEENEELYSKLLKHEKYKNNYFVNLSHELRTPLNVIMSIQKLIENLNNKKGYIPKEKISYYMETMDRNCMRLSNLIDNIIHTSKIEQGNHKLNIIEYDIVYLVEDVVLSMKEYIEENGIELIIDTDVEEKIIECDKLEIERSIINLMSNAVKFTEPGGKIEVNITDLIDCIKISVKDTGIGIDEKSKKSVFNRFDQDYKGSFEENGGKGLGLTLTRQLIELHGGNIWVESELGKGSEFSILLPVRHDLTKVNNS